MALGLGTFLGDPDSTTKAFTDLKMELDKEKVAQEKAQTEVDMLTRAVKDWKISADNFAAQIPTLEEKVNHLENKLVDGLNEVRTSELCLEWTTRANDDYKKQNTQLTRKLESKFPSSFKALFQS
jgi:predicted  nucleic acid-binding Zn-ribbon protein